MRELVVPLIQWKRAMSGELVVTPIRKDRVSQRIAVEICRMIREGFLKPGDSLPSERVLARELQVSRTSLREALRGLEIGGIVETRHGGGTFVRDSSDDGIYSPLWLLLSATSDHVGDLLEVRTIFEPPIAARAATRARPEHIAALEENVKRHERFHGRPAASEDWNEEWMENDRAFHVAVARASRNQVAVRVIGLINELLWEGRSHFMLSRARRDSAVKSHRAILNAIGRGDAQQAREAMLLHLHEVEKFIVAEVIESSEVSESEAGSKESAAGN